MKITIESTTKMVDLVINGVPVTVRLWQGQTEGGIPMHALIARVAVNKDEDVSQFEVELIEKAAPRVEFETYPLRLIL